jgi:hypothetical protein
VNPSGSSMPSHDGWSMPRSSRDGMKSRRLHVRRLNSSRIRAFADDRRIGLSVVVDDELEGFRTGGSRLPEAPRFQ